MSKKEHIKYIALIIGFGTICSLIIGLLFFGLKIFDTKHPLFEFFTFGIIGSVAFSLFNTKRFRDAIFALIFLFFFNVIIVGMSKASILITYLLYFSGVILSTYLFIKYFYNQLANIKIARPMVLAGILAILFVVVTITQWILFASGEKQFYVLSNLPLGFLLGLSLGIGFELSDYLSSKKILS